MSVQCIHSWPVSQWEFFAIPLAKKHHFSFNLTSLSQVDYWEEALGTSGYVKQDTDWRREEDKAGKSEMWQ
jgi:hypothetical protein